MILTMVLLPSFAALATEVIVYKDPKCGCCSKWVEHMRTNGFEVKVEDVPNIGDIKKEQGIPRELGACHTSLVDGYKVEGHVPADVVKRLLSERPKVAGIAVPGMPMGSPGMEGPTRNSYDILTFGGEDGITVYESR